MLKGWDLGILELGERARPEVDCDRGCVLWLWKGMEMRKWDSRDGDGCGCGWRMVTILMSHGYCILFRFADHTIY